MCLYRIYYLAALFIFTEALAEPLTPTRSSYDTLGTTAAESRRFGGRAYYLNSTERFSFGFSEEDARLFAAMRLQQAISAQISIKSSGWSQLTTIAWLSAGNISALQEELEDIDNGRSRKKRHVAVLQYLLLYPLLSAIPYVPLIRQQIPNYIDFNIGVDRKKVFLEIRVKFQPTWW